MTQSLCNKRLAATVAVVWTVVLCSAADAQLIRAPLTEGFVRTSSIDITVDEMLGSAKPRAADAPILGPGYPGLWVAEIQYKPMRLIRMPVTDPGSGKVTRELVWYLVYRIIPRDYTELAGDGKEALARKLEDPDRDPANSRDPVRAQPLLMPRFQLTIEDEGEEGDFMDEVNLEIQKAILDREFGRRRTSVKLHNSVEAISEVSDPVSTSDPDPLSKAIYGVAVWRNIDPRTDYFSIGISGLTNAYRISGNEETGRTVEEKIVVQKFARPGDEFIQEESEFQLLDSVDTDGDGRADATYPRWEYRTRPANLQVPELDTVLRKARKDSVVEPE